MHSAFLLLYIICSNNYNICLNLYSILSFEYTYFICTISIKWLNLLWYFPVSTFYLFSQICLELIGLCSVLFFCVSYVIDVPSSSFVQKMRQVVRSVLRRNQQNTATYYSKIPSLSIVELVNETTPSNCISILDPFRTMNTHK